jgi:hypothetical protein
LGAQARRGKERQEESRGKGTSAATTGNLLGIVFGKRDAIAKMQKQRKWEGGVRR